MSYVIRNKAFQALDVARILRALDDFEFSDVLNEVVTDVTLAERSLLRSELMAAAGTRAHFINAPFAESVAPLEDVKEFTIHNSPSPGNSTV